MDTSFAKSLFAMFYDSGELRKRHQFVRLDAVFLLSRPGRAVAVLTARV